MILAHHYAYFGAMITQESDIFHVPENAPSSLTGELSADQ